MPVYICRWPNGDFSFVSAANKQEAVETLDEIANAEGCSLSVVENFRVHFRLEEDGTFELEGFGEETEEVIWKEYPILDKTLDHVFRAVQGEPLTRWRLGLRRFKEARQPLSLMRFCPRLLLLR